MAADKKPGPDAVSSDVTFDPAVAWFQKRLGMTRAQVNRLTLDARRKVFFVTGLSDLEVIKSVQDSLARAIENGSTFEEWKKEVKEKKLFQGPEFNHRRLETIFRTNIQNAFATGRYMEMTAPAVLKRRPYWRFSAVRDGRTTKVCAAAHGTILPANHPWWKTHIPPLHFNCRSTFVPMTEKDAKAAGITKTPTELNSALGFGNPPDGVPAAAKDMPTEEERQAAEKASEEVQTAVEERQNASSELTTAKHEKTVADRKLKTAEKELLRAPQEEVPERKKDVEEAKKASKAAEKHVEKAKNGLEKAEKHVEEVTAANENKPRSWTLVPERLKRLAKGVAKSAVSVMSTILGPFRKLKDAVVDEVPVLEGATPDGQKIHFKRGDITRAPMMRYAGKTSKIKPQKPKTFFDISGIPPEEGERIFRHDPKNPNEAEIRQKATGITQKTAVILAKEQIPDGVLPRVGKDVPERERERPQEPLGSRHHLPLIPSSRGKLENTMFSTKDASIIQKDMDAIRNGEGIPVKIKTTYRNGTKPPDFYGYIVNRGGKIHIYGMEKNGQNWRAFPVAGDDFLCLNKFEYKALGEMLFDNKTINNVALDEHELIEAGRFNLERVWHAFNISQEARQ